MTRGKKIAAFVAAAAVTTTCVAVFSACGEGEGSSVAGTYVLDYSLSEISGNVESNGYLVALQCTETNTLVLKEDNTYEYTKYIVSHRDMGTASVYSSATTVSHIMSTSAAVQAEDDGVLFAFASAGDGNCTFVCNEDGTYEFVYTTMGLSEKGTWTWENWTFTLKQSNGTEITATLDDSHNLNFTYTAVASSALTHDFTCGSDVWGAAFGGAGSYTPVESEGNGNGSDTTETPSYTGGIEITYTFYGTYTAEGATVTLNPATTCSWSESWGALQMYGFINGNGTETTKVSRHESEAIDPLNYFGGKFFIESDNSEVTVTLDATNKTFKYVEVSAFD